MHMQTVTHTICKLQIQGNNNKSQHPNKNPTPNHPSKSKHIYADAACASIIRTLSCWFWTITIKTSPNESIRRTDTRPKVKVWVFWDHRFIGTSFFIRLGNFPPGFFGRVSSPSSHNHGSVEKGCISNMEVFSFHLGWLSTSMIMGERVASRKSVFLVGRNFRSWQNDP